eukprot:COSAG02_NODE_688_length_18473_cov_77.428105_7_plen_147_part_00
MPAGNLSQRNSETDCPKIKTSKKSTPLNVRNTHRSVIKVCPVYDVPALPKLRYVFHTEKKKAAPRDPNGAPRGLIHRLGQNATHRCQNNTNFNSNPRKSPSDWRWPGGPLNFSVGSLYPKRIQRRPSRSHSSAGVFTGWVGIVWSR